MTAGAADLFDGWLALVKAKHTQSALPKADTDLFALMLAAANSAVTDDAFFAGLNEATGWSMDPVSGTVMHDVSGAELDVAELFADAMGFSRDALLETRRHAVREAFGIADTYARINSAVQWMRRWRVAPQTLVEWSDGDRPAGDLADSLQAAARARHSDDSDWYRVLRPISDRLRERKRDALLAYLLAHGANRGGDPTHRFEDAAAVYGHYLIDPEMNSCMLTTRIVQANAAVQLFVQRILQNLEDEVRPAAVYAEEWHRHWQRWPVMKNYRVWEANRKVFLYPENWLFPELRDDKSPFFAEFENALLQDEVTDATVSKAYREYLAKLHEVARLDMRGFYIEEPPNARGQLDKQVMHQFARTYSEPHFYFYRCRNMLNRTWSAWEKVDLNIEGDHLIPVVHNGQLMLFWPQFREKGGGSEGSGFAEYELSLAYSRYGDGRWQAAKTGTSKKTIRAAERETLSFRADSSDGKLQVLAYSAYLREPPERRFRGNSDPGKLLEVPMGTAVSVFSFTVGPCHDTLVLEPVVPARVLVYPHGTEIAETNFVETQAEGDQLHLLLAPLADDTIDIDELIFSDRLISGWVKNQGSKWLEKGGPSSVHTAEWVFGAGGIDEVRNILAAARFAPLLGTTPGRFRLTAGAQFRQLDGERPFFFQDENQSMLISPEWPAFATAGGIMFPFYWYWRTHRFELAYHPFICLILKMFQTEGIQGLLKPAAFLSDARWGSKRNELDRQYTKPKPSPLWDYAPNAAVVAQPYPLESIDFDLTTAYGQYNWELFFHIPLFVATRLSQAQRFEDAQKWFHYIFDPTDTSPHPSPARYWRVKPLFELVLEPPETLTQLLEGIATRDTQALEQVAAWRDDPFNPHAIARLRNIAYMKAVVMGYLDNLIAWADDLFPQDSHESLNEAAQLYLLAMGILGSRPVQMAARERPDYSYAQLTGAGGAADELGNMWLELESMLPIDPGNAASCRGGPPLRLLPYFCIPANDKLLAYWDTVADRLFKMRHCLDIEGRLRELPLFDPPIDPALLVRARAAGVDLRAALRRSGDVPHYRFVVVHQKALEFCGEVRALGGALLAALEKRDAEALGLLRSTHELNLLREMSQIRDRQVEEARETLEGLRRSRLVAERRQDFYGSREFMNPAEIAAMTLQTAAHIAETLGQGPTVAATAAYLFPQIHAQAVASGASTGGKQVGDSLGAAAATARLIASQFSFAASLSSTIGGYSASRGRLETAGGSRRTRNRPDRQADPRRRYPLEDCGEGA